MVVLSLPSSSFLLAALSTLETEERYFLAGGLCASISHALACPIDVVKTRQQTVPEYRDLSLLDGLTRCASDEGAAALLTGVGPTIVGYGLEGACKFGVYESLKPSLASLGPEVGPILAAIVAGGLASLVLAPVEATRIRMVTDSSYNKGLLDAASRLLNEEGADSLLRGVPATCSKQLPYTATKQVTFDLLRAGGDFALPLPAFACTAAAAASAAVLSTLASQPGDAILSEVVSDNGVSTIRGAVGTLGASGLARGLRARLVQVGVIVTVQLVLYDTLKHAFGVP